MVKRSIPSVDVSEIPAMLVPKTIRARLADGEFTEEQFVELLTARGISLVEANEMDDDELIMALLTGVRRIWTSRFTKDVDDLHVHDMDIRKVLSDNALSAGMVG